MPPLPKENRPARVNSAKWEFVEIFMVFPPPLCKQTAMTVKSTTIWDNWLTILLAFPIPVMKLSSVKRNHSCETLITDQCPGNTLMKLSTQKQRVTYINMMNPFH